MTDTPIALKPRAILIDTNVWINSQLGLRNGYEHARALIVKARRKGLRIGIALHSLTDIFYVVQSELKHLNDKEGGIPPERAAYAAREAAWGVINNIMEYAEVVGADGSDARIAALHKAVHDDFEDDLVIAAARRMRADLVVSDDLSFVKHSPLPTMTAADALKWI